MGCASSVPTAYNATIIPEVARTPRFLESEARTSDIVVGRLQTHHAVKVGVVDIGCHADTSTIGERGLPKDILRQSNEAALAHIAPCHLHFCQMQEEVKDLEASLAQYEANHSEHDAHHLARLEFLLNRARKRREKAEAHLVAYTLAAKKWYGQEVRTRTSDHYDGSLASDREVVRGSVGL
jgi:hypothetical protein